MEKILNLQRQLFRSKRLTLLVVAITLVILAAAIFSAQMALRKKMRNQIVQQDAEVLQSVALMQHQAELASGEFIGPLDDPESYFDEVLQISKLRGVLAVRLFDAEGKFVNAIPSYIVEESLLEDDFEKLHQLKPVSHFYPHAAIGDFDLLSHASKSDETSPLLEVSIALPSQGGFAGVAQFLIQGGNIAAAFAELDHSLVSEGCLVFLGCGSALGVLLWVAFQRIQKMNRLLMEANRDLALAAKTSAVGAVAAHLIHGLRNPIGGLQSFVSSHSDNDESPAPGDWETAIATTQRMQALVNQVVGILQDQKTGNSYELTTQEVVEAVASKMLTIAQRAGVILQTNATGDTVLSSSDGNLILLILENLIQNAIQATPAGKHVVLKSSLESSRIIFEVSDEGAGFPEHLKETLFKPCTSTKVGGSGIGLAICHQLASHLGATLELKRTGSDGSVFLLSVPSQPVIDAHSQSHSSTP